MILNLSKVRWSISLMYFSWIIQLRPSLVYYNLGTGNSLLKRLKKIALVAFVLATCIFLLHLL
jgi:hypothetical protein